MCMAVYATGPDEQIQLTFLLERIYLRRDGTTSITADMLVQNMGSTPLQRIRILLPYAFVKIGVSDSLDRLDLDQAPQVFNELRKKEAQAIGVNSEEIKEYKDASNWIYGATLPHAVLGAGAHGTIEVRRYGQDHGNAIVNGYVKSNWEMNTVKELDEWMWFILAVNKFAMVDIVAPQYEPREYLQAK